MTIGLIGQWVVSVLVGAIGGLGGIALGTMTEFGRKIVSYPFDRRLQALRHTQDTQIENLRAELSRIGDRNIRSNEREYNAIVAAWESYVDARRRRSYC